MKIEWLSFICFVLAGLIHIGFFIFESFVLQKKGAHKMLRITEAEHSVVKVWALNQGYYNLFLAIGTFIGLSFIFQKKIELAGVLTSFCGISMVAAGAVLWLTVPSSRKAALFQMVPPLLGFVFLFFHIASFTK